MQNQPRPHRSGGVGRPQQKLQKNAEEQVQQQNYSSQSILPSSVWNICQNYQSVVFGTNIVTLILGAINIGIIGFNFSWSKGSYRQSLFHSELTFLVVFSIAFVLTCISVIVHYLKGDTNIHSNIHSIVSSFISALCGGFAAMILLIQLAQYGRYFVEQHEAKVFAGVLGIIQSLLHGIAGFILYKGRQDTVS